MAKEIPQSHTADQHMALRGRDAEHRQAQILLPVPVTVKQTA